MSLEAKMLYGLILERMSSYEENHWQDEKGHVYVIYPEKEIMEDMNCSEEGVAKCLSELENSGLLEREIGQGNAPTRLYLKRLVYKKGGVIVAEKVTMDYFWGQDVPMSQFYRVPKSLYTYLTSSM